MVNNDHARLKPLRNNTPVTSSLSVSVVAGTGVSTENRRTAVSHW